MSFFVGYYVLSWTGPTGTAPASNASAPINVSSTAQTKSGRFDAASFYDADEVSYYVNPSGTSVLYGSVTVPTVYGSSSASGNLTLNSTSNATKGYVILNSGGGNVGIGTTGPGAKLDINGDMLIRNNFNWAAQANANGNPEDSLRFTTTHSTGSNPYTYYKISSPSYTIVSGDTLEYDIYCDTTNVSGICDGGAEMDFSDLTVGRSFSIPDQNGIGLLNGDHSSYSKGRWYHRKHSLANVVGKTISSFDVVEENDTVGTYTYYYRKIVITNGSTTKFIIWQGGIPSVQTVNYSNLASNISASGSYFAGGYFSGNVGIGTTSPNASSKLDVNGAIYQRGSVLHADVAEDYPVIGKTEAGDVVSFAGDRSVKKADTDESVAGVISESPGYRIRGEEGWVPVALAGRVQVKFIGSVSAGDYVFSRGDGTATDGIRSLENMKLIIGKALETSTCSSMCKLWVMVGRM